LFKKSTRSNKFGKMFESSAGVLTVFGKIATTQEV
jgi:hypothetical protein